MSKNDEWKAGYASLQVHPDATVHDALNDATELFQYASAIVGLLIDQAHDAVPINARKMAFALGGVNMLMRLGVQCVSHAHACVSLDRAAAMHAST
jgi:hypothetical protein